MPTGNETLLVVEDDPTVGELVRDVLEPLGYSVLTTASGEEALAASEAHAGPIHLLLTDVVMPGMNGKQLAEVLRAKRPGIRVLFMTGYTRDALSTQGMMEPGIVSGMGEYVTHAVLGLHRDAPAYAQQQRAHRWAELRVVPAGERRAEKILGVRCKVIRSRHAEIGMDVDKPFQLDIARAVLNS